MTIEEQISDLDARRISHGVCRHCGGPVPCWSNRGDVMVGTRHSPMTDKIVEKAFADARGHVPRRLYKRPVYQRIYNKARALADLKYR